MVSVEITPLPEAAKRWQRLYTKIVKKMKNILKLIPVFLLIISCKDNDNKNLEKENELLKKEIQLQKKEDSLNKITSKVVSENERQKNIKSTESENIYNSKYGYIKNYKGKYPHDLNLFEKGVLKTQLINLLGKEKYNVFLQNMSVQIPIEIINDEYTFITGGAPHSFGYDVACIEIDFVNDKISVGILTEGKDVFYFTEKENKSQKQTEGKLNSWLYEANQTIKNND